MLIILDDYSDYYTLIEIILKYATILHGILSK